MLLITKVGNRKHPKSSGRGLQVEEGQVLLLFMGSCIFHISIKLTFMTNKRKIYSLQILL